MTTPHPSMQDLAAAFRRFGEVLQGATDGFRRVAEAFDASQRKIAERRHGSVWLSAYQDAMRLRWEAHNSVRRQQGREHMPWDQWIASADDRGESRRYADQIAAEKRAGAKENA